MTPEEKANRGIELLARMDKGEAIRMSDDDISCVCLTPDSDRLRTARNDDQVGTLDRYIGWTIGVPPGFGLNRDSKRDMPFAYGRPGMTTPGNCW